MMMMVNGDDDNNVHDINLTLYVHRGVGGGGGGGGAPTIRI